MSPLLSLSLSLTGSRGRTNCCVGGAGAATRTFVPRCLRLGSRSLLPAPRPRQIEVGGTYPTPVTPRPCGWSTTASSALLQPGLAGAGCWWPCPCHGGRVALRGREDPSSSLCIPPPFSPSLQISPISTLTLAVGCGSQSHSNSSTSSRHHLPAHIAVLSHSSPVSCLSFPPWQQDQVCVWSRVCPSPSRGPRGGAAPISWWFSLPQMPGSLLPALQLGSGLRRWLGEGFFPGCNFSLLHTVCFEQCLEASHPRLTAGAGECAGCQVREAPAPDPSSLGEITAN